MTDKMPIKEIVLRLGHWKARIKKLEAQIDAFADMTGARSDSPFLDNIYGMIDAYTASVSELIGDKWDWLSWYRNECEMGRNPLVSALSGQEIKVKTLRQLARAIQNG